MDYDLHQSKKFLRKNRVQIALGLLTFVIIIALISHFAGSNKEKFIGNPESESPIQKTTNDTTNTNQNKPVPKVTTLIDSYEIVKTYVRNGKQYYTQGLIFKDSDTLIESAGLYKQSTIQYLNLKDMTVGLQSNLNAKYFGEGCELYDNNGQEEIYQLTWLERKIVVWNAKDLTQKREIDLPRPIQEGWGITKRFETNDKGNSEAVFYVSDGTDIIYVVDPLTFTIKRSFPVMKSDKTTVRSLNELEFIKGKLWANVYFSNHIMVIDPDTGFVEYTIDLSKLNILAQDKAREMGLEFKRDFVLNGIAYDSKTDKLIIAGKKWPLMWEIKVNGI